MTGEEEVAPEPGPECHWCGQIGPVMKACCAQHPDILRCANVTACMEFSLAKDRWLRQEHGG